MTFIYILIFHLCILFLFLKHFGHFMHIVKTSKSSINWSLPLANSDFNIIDYMSTDILHLFGGGGEGGKRARFMDWLYKLNISRPSLGWASSCSHPLISLTALRLLISLCIAASFNISSLKRWPKMIARYNLSSVICLIRNPWQISSNPLTLYLWDRFIKPSASSNVRSSGRSPP